MKRSAAGTKKKGAEEMSGRLPQCLVPLVELDKRLTDRLAVCADQHSLRTHMKALEISCHGVPWFFACAALIASSWSDDVTQVAINLFIALLLDITLVAVTKALVRRTRPQHNRMDMFATVSVDRYSFPSGHASRAVMVSLLLVDRGGLGALAGSLLAVWSFVVCVSRVLLGRHHVSDVLAGVLLGYAESQVSAAMWLSARTCRGLLDAVVNFDHEP